MKRELINIIACPVCKGELELGVDKDNEQEVVTGSLHCPGCGQHFPVVDSIPNLLPPDQRDQSGL